MYSLIDILLNPAIIIIGIKVFIVPFLPAAYIDKKFFSIIIDIVDSSILYANKLFYQNFF